MGLRIATNVEAFNSHRLLSANSSKLAKSMQKLSSGFRINSAADDAAGLGISERMRGQIRGMDMAQRNVQDGISMVQTAEGSMQTLSSILQRARELAVQYANGTGGAGAQAAITAEMAQLSAEAGRIIASTNFNGIALLNGGANTVLQVGPGATDTMSVTTTNATTSLGSSLSSATPSIASIDAAIAAIATDRSALGAIQNRLEYANDSLAIARENMMAAESRIRDVDMAAEMANYTRLQILQESGIAMLAQANGSQQSILSLLR